MKNQFGIAGTESDSDVRRVSEMSAERFGIMRSSWVIPQP